MTIKRMVDLTAAEDRRANRLIQQERLFAFEDDEGYKSIDYEKFKSIKNRKSGRPKGSMGK